LKYLRNTLVALVLLVALAAALLWFLPARWALPWIEPQLQGLRLQQVHGLLWNGEAEAVSSVDGQELGQLHWRLSRRALLGDVRLQLKFDGPQLRFSGVVRRLPDSRFAVDDLRLHADLAVLEAYPASPWGRPLGELQLTAEHVLLQGGWPLQLQAHGLWQRGGAHGGWRRCARGHAPRGASAGWVDPGAVAQSRHRAAAGKGRAATQSAGLATGHHAACPTD
jgi:general secretion pathway protein N